MGHPVEFYNFLFANLLPELFDAGGVAEVGAELAEGALQRPGLLRHRRHELHRIHAAEI